MARILVSDSSALIEFSKRGLLDKVFRLPFEFVVPDLLFEEELIDPRCHVPGTELARRIRQLSE